MSYLLQACFYLNIETPEDLSMTFIEFEKNKDKKGNLHYNEIKIVPSKWDGIGMIELIRRVMLEIKGKYPTDPVTGLPQEVPNPLCLQTGAQQWEDFIQEVKTLSPYNTL